MSQTATTDKPSAFQEFLVTAAIFAGFLLFIFFIMNFMNSTITEERRGLGVLNIYREAITLLSRNADNEGPVYHSTLREYTECLADEGEKRAVFAKANETINESNSVDYANLRLPLDLKVCQEKVIKEAAGKIGPGADSSKVIQQMKADIAKANSYLYTPKAFLSK